MKVWRGGGKCGRASKLTGDDNARHSCLPPGVRADVSEILGPYILSRDPVVQEGFRYLLGGRLIETLIEVPTVWVGSRPFIGIQGATSSVWASVTEWALVVHGSVGRRRMCRRPLRAPGSKFRANLI